MKRAKLYVVSGTGNTLLVGREMMGIFSTTLHQFALGSQPRECGIYYSEICPQA